MRNNKLILVQKAMILLVFLGFSMNAFAHTSFTVSIGGGPAYYPAPVYYGPPAPVQNIVWVPAHRENRYWVPGHYVEYIVPAPSQEMIWMDGGYHRHHDHWRHF